MGPPWGRLLLLGAASVAFLQGNIIVASSHSLHYSFTVVSEPGLDLPQFMVSGYFDDQLIAYYDSKKRSGIPRTDWMEEMVKVDPQYWDWLNQNARNVEQVFKWYLGVVMRQYNHSEGLHTMQWIFSCTLGQEGLKGGSNKFSYDGREALSFNMETLTWTANGAVAEDYKRKWESEPGRTQRSKIYLEEKCISMLLKHLEVRKKVAEKRVTPVVKVTRSTGTSGLEILTCHIHGFYPKEIDATWRKDGEVQEQETFRGNIVPNSDGTYNTWLSIEIDQKDGDKYQCHVEHDSLPESPDTDPDLASEETGSSISSWTILGGVLVLTVTMAVAVFIIISIKKRGSQTLTATNAEMQDLNPSRKRRRVHICDTN